MSYTKAKKIAEINDAMRKNFTGGRFVITQGVKNNLDIVERSELMRLVMNCDNFNKTNDPYNEHDFGVITMKGTKYFWKIDYYALDMKYHSEDPANIEITNRVMTIMLAEEY